MNRITRVVAAAGAASVVLAGMPAAIAAATSSASTTTTASATSRLVGFRAAHHPGFDRFVLRFRGPVPTHHSVRWVDRVIQDGSGLPIRVAGHRFLSISVSNAVAHTSSGAPTVLSRRTWALPNITQNVLAGDFEGVVTVGLGLQRRTTKHVFTLSSPSRLVIDITTPYSTTPVGVWFLNADNYASGTKPFAVKRMRPAIPPRIAKQALGRLFAGVTLAERKHALRFIRSDATGFRDLRIEDGIARVQLRGGCNSHGSTFTVANEIIPTLKQFASVDHVKIYDPSGQTEEPTGRTDSIPECLEP